MPINTFLQWFRYPALCIGSPGTPRIHAVKLFPNSTFFFASAAASHRQKEKFQVEALLTLLLSSKIAKVISYTSEQQYEMKQNFFSASIV